MNLPVETNCLTLEEELTHCFTKTFVSKSQTKCACDLRLSSLGQKFATFCSTSHYMEGLLKCRLQVPYPKKSVSSKWNLIICISNSS